MSTDFHLMTELLLTTTRVREAVNRVTRVARLDDFQDDRGKGRESAPRGSPTNGSVPAPPNSKPCECGCGTLIPAFDRKRRPRRYYPGHYVKTAEHIRDATERMRRVQKEYGPWNTGKSYRVSVREVYANRGSWMQAIMRTYEDKCMICGWNEAPCDCHHIIPRRSRGPNTIENGVVLCPNCHRLVERGRLSEEQIRKAKARAPVIGFVAGRGRKRIRMKPKG